MRTATVQIGTIDESRLLAALGAGDVNAFDHLYRLYQPRLERFLTNLLRRPELVEEVLDDTMAVVWRTSASFRGASKLSTWIFAIAYRHALKARRRWPRPVEDPGFDTSVDPGPGPDEQLQHRGLHEMLIAAMGKLSADHRTVVDLTYFHGLGYHEIAEVMNCPEGTVKTRMFHARRRLKHCLSGAMTDWL